jgi:hypothetical protein
MKIYHHKNTYLILNVAFLTIYQTDKEQPHQTTIPLSQSIFKLVSVYISIISLVWQTFLLII